MTADQHDPGPPRVVWTHPSGRQIAIYTDRKIRSGFHFPDEWPVLYREVVPSLTDAEWYDMPADDLSGWICEPGDGWKYDNGQQAFRREHP